MLFPIVSKRLVEDFPSSERFYFPSIFVGTSVKILHISSWVLWVLVEINPEFWSEVPFSFAYVSHSILNINHLSSGPIW